MDKPNKSRNHHTKHGHTLSKKKNYVHNHLNDRDVDSVANHLETHHKKPVKKSKHHQKKHDSEVVKAVTET